MTRFITPSRLVVDLRDHEPGLPAGRGPLLEDELTELGATGRAKHLAGRLATPAG
jgi:hypothetical protein